MRSVWLYQRSALTPPAVLTGAVVSPVLGGASTVKPAALEAVAPLGVTVTLTLPGARLVGTLAVTLVALQAVVVAVVPPNFTVPPVPRLVPAMTTLAPVGPWFGVEGRDGGCGCRGRRRVDGEASALEAVAPVGVTVTLTLPGARLAAPWR